MIWDQRSADERGKPHAYLQLKRICAFRQVNEGEGVPVTSEASPWLRWLEMSAVSITSPYVTMTADMNSVRADEQFTGRGLHRRHHRGAVQFAPAGDHFAEPCVYCTLALHGHISAEVPSVVAGIFIFTFDTCTATIKWHEQLTGD